MVCAKLPIIARRAVLASDWKDVGVWHNLDKSRHALPRFRLEEQIRSQVSKELFDLLLAMLYDEDLARDYEKPQLHQAIDCGIHREKVRVHHGTDDFSDMYAGAAAIKCTLREAEIFLWKVGLPSKNGFNAHRSQVALADRCCRICLRRRYWYAVVR